MNCGCTKHVGCFAPGQTIDFGFDVPCAGDYTFEIWGANGTYTEIVVTFTEDDRMTLPMTFNENATTTIKIQTPECIRDDNPLFYYFTTFDGACSWSVDGITPVC